MKNKFLHYILSLSLVFSPVTAFSQTTGEIKYETSDMLFYNGTTWVSMNTADSLA